MKWKFVYKNGDEFLSDKDHIYEAFLDGFRNTGNSWQHIKTVEHLV
jgi:hypothetical protein